MAPIAVEDEIRQGEPPQTPVWGTGPLENSPLARGLRGIKSWHPEARKTTQITSDGSSLPANATSLGGSVHIVHIGSSGLSQVPLNLDMIEGAQRAGVDVTTEVYPYTAALMARNS